MACVGWTIAISYEIGDFQKHVSFLMGVSRYKFLELYLYKEFAHGTKEFGYRSTVGISDSTRSLAVYPYFPCVN